MTIPNRRTSALSLAIVGTFAMVLPAPSAAAEDFYKGKTLTVMVGLAAGGTVDTFARLFAGYWQKHIPGNPTIVVRNMTGGGGLRVTNFVYEAVQPDGLTVLWGSWFPIDQALGTKALRARYEKFPFLGGTPDIRVGYARTDSIPGGLKKASDIAKAKGLWVGGNTATGMAHLSGRIPLDVLGVSYRQVVGYRGGSDIFLAMQQGEVQYTATSIGTFRTRSGDFIKSGTGMGLFYLVPVAPDGSYERNKYITEMPAFPDLYKEIHGKMPSGPVWEALNWFTTLSGTMQYAGFAPPGTPAAALEALRKGYAAASGDPEFEADSIKRNGIPYGFVDVKTGERVIQTLANTDPKVLATFKDLIEKGAKADKEVSAK